MYINVPIFWLSFLPKYLFLAIVPFESDLIVAVNTLFTCSGLYGNFDAAQPELLCLN